MNMKKWASFPKLTVSFYIVSVYLTFTLSTGANWNALFRSCDQETSVMQKLALFSHLIMLMDNKVISHRRFVFWKYISKTNFI